LKVFYYSYISGIHRRLWNFAFFLLAERESWKVNVRREKKREWSEERGKSGELGLKKLCDRENDGGHQNLKNSTYNRGVLERFKGQGDDKETEHWTSPSRKNLGGTFSRNWLAVGRRSSSDLDFSKIFSTFNIMLGERWDKNRGEWAQLLVLKPAKSYDVSVVKKVSSFVYLTWIYHV